MIPFVNLANPLPTTPGTGLTAGQEAELATATRRQPVASIAALKDLTPSAGDAVQVLGYYAAGDGGGGVFYYDAVSVAADNGGTVIAPTAGSGRWLRVVPGGTLSLPMFGIFPHATTTQTTAIQAAVDYAADQKVPLYVPPGTYRVKKLYIRAGSHIYGAGPETVFKLTDGGVDWDMVMRTESTQTSDVDNVTLRDFTVHGNVQDHGLTVNQMHGIGIYGAHDNWTIERVVSRDTGGDGIWITSASSGTLIPTNIKVRGHTAINVGRMDIAVVNVDGCTISDCSGDGMFDVEANDAAETCKNIVLSNLRYDIILVSPLGADTTSTGDNAITGTGLNATTRVKLWAVGNSTFTNIRAGEEVVVANCYRCVVSDVISKHMTVQAANGYHCRECSISDVVLTGGAVGYDYSLSLSSTTGCSFANLVIDQPTPSSDGIKISNATVPPAANYTTFENVLIRSNTRYGVYIIPTDKMSGCTVVFRGLRILSAGTNPIYVTTASGGYGDYIFRDCDVTGTPNIAKFASVSIDGMIIRGNYNLNINYHAGASMDVDRVKFIRTSAGTPTISMTNSTDIARLRIGRIEQVPTGGFTLAMGTSTFAAGVKAWIDGPVVEATTWGSSLADAAIHAGSLYRLRGNATNWGYTHNGSAWVAKAH